MKGKMIGATLPGNSTVEFKEFDIPTPGHGQVLIRTMASTICGSDIRCIYREHTGKGAEGYIDGMIAGHEPCGIIVEEGEGLKRFKKGDRVIIYHISGCGVCYDCRRGYAISCTSEHRQAYGWQRNGGMAPYILAEEKDLIPLPDSLSYLDGAQVACGFGTTYEALEKIGVSGDDAVLVVGLGPVGLATAMLAKAMGAQSVIGVEYSEDRIEIAKGLGLFDHVFRSDDTAMDNILAVRAEKASKKQLTVRQTTRQTACDPCYAFVRQDRIRRRRQHLHLPTQSRYHSRAEDHIRQLGDLSVENGRTRRKTGTLGHSSRQARHTQIPVGKSRRSIRFDGKRQMRKSCCCL